MSNENRAEVLAGKVREEVRDLSLEDAVEITELVIDSLKSDLDAMEDDLRNRDSGGR